MGMTMKRTYLWILAVAAALLLGWAPAWAAEVKAKPELKSDPEAKPDETKAEPKPKAAIKEQS